MDIDSDILKGVYFRADEFGENQFWSQINPGDING